MELKLRQDSLSEFYERLEDLIEQVNGMAEDNEDRRSCLCLLSVRFLLTQ